jgi:tripartite-type tricarboxylate transporter receptor subunit TctC
MTAMQRPTTILFAVMCALGSAICASQVYPSKNVRLVVPYTPGSSTDILGRILSAKMTEAFGQPAIVDNRAGAGGTLGAAYVANAAPDGHTLLLGSVGSLGTAPGLYKNLPYDPTKDFAPVTLLVRAASVIVVHPSLPVSSVKELVALAKKRPGELNFSSGGNGSPSHLGMELLGTMTGIKIVHVPYKGPEEALTQLMAGQEIHMAMQSGIAVLPLIQARRLKAIAVTGKDRLKELPEVPTVGSQIPGFSVYAWYAMLAPANTPAPVVAKLNSEMARILHLPDVSSKVQAQGGEVATGTPQQLSDFLRSEVAQWTRVIKAANAHLD